MGTNASLSRGSIAACLLPLLWLAAGAGASAQTVLFADVAAQALDSIPRYGRGAALVDLDGDGRLDLVAANAGMANDFFRQQADHSFTRVNGLWDVADDLRESWAALVADFDNDGDPDVYFVNGGFAAIHPNQLLRNDLDSAGVFVDVTVGAGDAGSLAQNFGGTALDYDRDGDLDLFLTVASVLGGPNVVNTLLRNDGDLVFSDVTVAAGIVHAGDFRHCSSGDFDNDGWIDLAVGNFVGDNLLYRNNGNGTFSDVAVAAGVGSPSLNFGLALEDFDNDGWMDLFAPKYQLEPTGPSRLFVNDGDGTFSDVSEAAGLTGQTDMGHNTGDLDGDGYPDLFIGTGAPVAADFDHLFLVTPDGQAGLSASDVTAQAGLDSGGATRCHGTPIGDYDEDGRMDLFANNGGPSRRPDSIQAPLLWHNVTPGATRWVGLRLHGTVSNRSAVGARTTAVLSSTREIRRSVRVGTGFGNTDSPIQHFPIGPSESIARIEIRWPSGLAQVVERPEEGRITDVSEGDASLVVGRTIVKWQALVGVTNDLVRGDLGLLRATRGDFAQATTVCVADDRAGSLIANAHEPGPGAGWWYLLRRSNAGGVATFDSGGFGQLGSRDAGIAVSPGACP